MSGLQRDFAGHLEAIDLPPSVILERGEGGLPRVRVSGPITGQVGTAERQFSTAERQFSTAEIYLQGAHVTSWRPAGQESVIWMSRASAFSPGVPLRGGIPICFPWFGPNAVDSGAPLHGYARLCEWTLIEAEEQGDDISLAFRLDDSATIPTGTWPFPFEATYRVLIGTSLRVSLEITNRGVDTVSFEEALHTYLAVGDVREVALLGLVGETYLDRVVGGERVIEGTQPVRIQRETDRMYVDSSATVTIEDGRADRAIRIRKSGSDTTVVWNPWIEKSRAMTDFGDDEWTPTICVEACNAGPNRVLLGPGQAHRMGAILEVQPLGPGRVLPA